MAETLASIQALVDGVQGELSREATMLAREPAIIEGALKGDWATLARGASPRMVSLTLDRLADLVLILDAAGAPLVQAPASPQVVLPLPLGPAASSGRLAVLNDRLWLVGVAPLPAGTVVVGRRFESLARVLARLPSRPAVVALAGDRAVGATQPELPATGWEAAVRAGRTTVRGVPWLARPLGAVGAGGLVVLVPDGERVAAERRFWVVWAASLAAALAGGVWSAPVAGGTRRAA